MQGHVETTTLDYPKSHWTLKVHRSPCNVLLHAVFLSPKFSLFFSQYSQLQAKRFGVRKDILRKLHWHCHMNNLAGILFRWHSQKNVKDGTAQVYKQSTNMHYYTYNTMLSYLPRQARGQTVPFRWHVLLKYCSWSSPEISLQLPCICM